MPVSEMKVLVGNMPPMLRDIVQDAISKQPDMELEDMTTFAGPSEREPDIAVIGTTALGDDTRPMALLTRWPRSYVLMISISGRDAVMYELRPDKTPLGEMSPARLVEAIRSAYARSGRKWDPNGSGAKTT